MPHLQLCDSEVSILHRNVTKCARVNTKGFFGLKPTTIESQNRPCIRAFLSGNSLFDHLVIDSVNYVDWADAQFDPHYTNGSRRAKLQIAQDSSQACALSSGHLLPIDKFYSLMILLEDSEGPDQTARMRSLIWAFAGRVCPKIRFRLARHK